MALDNMTTDQILDALSEVGETGHAELRRGNELHIQREENADWHFIGTVDDIDDAQQVIDDWFNV